MIRLGEHGPQRLLLLGKRLDLLRVRLLSTPSLGSGHARAVGGNEPGKAVQELQLRQLRSSGSSVGVQVVADEGEAALDERGHAEKVEDMRIEMTVVVSSLGGLLGR